MSAYSYPGVQTELLLLAKSQGRMRWCCHLRDLLISSENNAATAAAAMEKEGCILLPCLCPGEQGGQYSRAGPRPLRVDIPKAYCVCRVDVLQA